jgi:hypothetical protein
MSGAGKHSHGSEEPTAGVLRRCRLLFAGILSISMVACAGIDSDSSRPQAERKSFSERLNESGGYKQNEDGAWVPKSDKRSSYDSQGDSPYFKGNVDKKAYKTGDYAKKSWWGSKDYAKKSYEGNTDGSRFQKSAQQDGMLSRNDGQQARLADPFKTNTLDNKSARESTHTAIDRPTDAATDIQRKTYKAPSVIDWRSQRNMSMEQSRGILGR